MSAAGRCFLVPLADLPTFQTRAEMAGATTEEHLQEHCSGRQGKESRLRSTGMDTGEVDQM